MRILIVTLTDDPLDPAGESRYGGAQIFMFDAGRHLVRAGHEVHFLTRQSRPDKPLRQSLGSRCHVHRITLGSPHELSHHELWRQRSEIVAAARELAAGTGPFDAALSFNWLSGVAAMAAAIRPHVHHILSLGRVRRALKEEPHPSDGARDEGELEVFAHADRLICACRDEYLSLRELYPEIELGKARIIPYGTDSDTFYRRPCSANDHLRRATL